MKTLFLSFLAIPALVLTACQSRTENLYPYVTASSDRTQSDAPKAELNPKVDILFVIDDSGSMREHQIRLAQNIDRFVDGFGKSSIIDFHIGVLTVWDSIRYGTYDVDANKVIESGVVPAVGRTGERLFDPIGQLRPLKAPAGKEAALKDQMRNYVIRGPEFTEILRETLKVGVSEFERYTSATKDARGPEFEEVLTPVLAALRPPLTTGANKGFYRPDAHLVVILVTDANDASSLTASQMNRLLLALKKSQDNFTIFGVVIPTGTNHGNCNRDNSGPPLKIEELIHMTKGKVLDLCQDYDKDLAEVGHMVQERTIGEIRIPLRHLPAIETIEVNYGSQAIPAGQAKGWVYDPELKAIIIRGAAELTYEPGAKISIRYEIVNPARSSSHCVGCTAGSI